ncbi:MAG: DUF4054 domain-containing protein [bacterium]
MINSNVYQIIANAGNIRTGGNPEYTAEDFLKMYPQFGVKRQSDDAEDNLLVTETVPNYVLEAWVKMAHASLHKNRYHDMWEIAMGLFIAHWLTLYLQTAADPEDQINKIISAGLAKGLQTSKSVGDVSVSYDFSLIGSDFDGWGTYGQTAFGQQFITIAKMSSLRGMVVW